MVWVFNGAWGTYGCCRWGREGRCGEGRGNKVMVVFNGAWGYVCCGWGRDEGGSVEEC